MQFKAIAAPQAGIYNDHKRREDNVSFQGEIRSGKGLVVGELHMSPNSSKAGQAKQNDREPPCEVSLPERSCSSLASLLPFGGWQNVEGARGKAVNLKS